MGALEARLGRPDSLADAALVGAWAGSGMTEAADAIEAPGGDAGMVNAPTPVPGVMLAGQEAAGLVPVSDLDPARREGLGRPQTHRISMGRSEQYDDAPALSGLHAVIAGRPTLPSGAQQLPWESSPETVYRDVPARDSDNPPPGDCS